MLFFFIVVLSPVFQLSEARASQTIVVNVIVNMDVKGENFVVMEDDGDFLVRTVDLASLGFLDLPGTKTIIENEEHISLRSMKGLTYRFNEKYLSLDLTASAELFPRRAIDFTPARASSVYRPRDSSAFLNYKLGYIGGDSMKMRSFNITNQLGMRSSDMLFMTDSSYTSDDLSSRFVRLQTNLTFDDRPELKRVVAGDFFASSGDLGSTVNMGGFSLSKSYRMDPYFTKYPTLNVSGVSESASDVEVYVDDIKLRSDKVAPGGFDLRNIAYTTGAHKAEVLIRDAFGNVQRIVHPFYQTDKMLKKGLHEYSYNGGLIRKSYGNESNSYGHAVMSASHRWGYEDFLTLGVQAETGAGVAHIGPEFIFPVKDLGLISTAVVAGKSRSGGGVGASANHNYQGKDTSTRLLFRGFSRNYANIVDGAPSTSKYEAGAGISRGFKRYGSVSLDYSISAMYVGTGSKTATLSYSKGVFDSATMLATLKRRVEARSSTEAFLGFVYYFDKDSSVSTNYQKTSGSSSLNVQAQRPAPANSEGWGYRVSTERNGVAGRSASYLLNPTVNVNTATALYRADVKVASGGQGYETYDLSAAGAVAYVGDTVALTRPITDSFAMIKVGDIEGVRAYVNNQRIGKTDANGVVFVPALNSYYDNQVSIDTSDVPMEYRMEGAMKFVSPPLRSGSCLSFDVRKTISYTGSLKAQTEGGLKPIEFQDVSLKTGAGTITFPTGRDGEFYFEEAETPAVTGDGCAALAAGKTASAGKKAVKSAVRYAGTSEHMGARCVFELPVVPTGSPFVEIGEVLCAPEAEAR
ncbi:MAG: fimbrial biogenesis outer membrane usher protein [Deltaproteobacteria bacterium]|nr:fimbrial biogenesis outer membrane usher protein [Deltaproteobacteria bacterium]